jgi:pyruvate formate lyase activating enzyme
LSANMANIPMKASFWTKENDTYSILCNLCPRQCLIGNGKRGFCKARENRDGVLYSIVYGYPVALQVDPIEKKPFAEFMSGTKTFSIGTYGCNLNCLFCQNYHLSRGIPPENTDILEPIHFSKLDRKGEPQDEDYASRSKDRHAHQQDRYFSPESIIKLSIKHNCRSVAFTYNEPTVWAEYAIDIAKLAKKNNLNVVLVSNGYITKQAAEVFYPLIDAANIDMKGFSEHFYSEMTGARLQPVLDSIKYLYSLNKHVELTNLIIPDKNNDDKMIDSFLSWVVQNLDKNVPLHFSAYHPMYKYNESPRTSPEILYNIRDIAKKRGFNHVYLGNI